MILISNEFVKKNEVDIINEWLSDSDNIFHLRRYHWSEQEVIDFLSLFTPQKRKQIVLNNHHSLAEKHSIVRIHFPEQERLKLSENNLKDLKSKDFILSTSIHTIKDFNLLSPLFDYAFISPIFDSISKENYKAVSFDLNEKRNNVKLIALGGITLDNFAKAIEMGFDDVAFLGGVWNNEQPEKTISELVKI